ncbi:hypothetical protein E0K89_010720 [Aquicoccus sp. SCR17]|nr:hypothetical protein [Carideicomes alvinocaridis]
MRQRDWLFLGGLALTGFVLARAVWQGQRLVTDAPERQSARLPADHRPQEVRQAGREEMKNPPRHWDRVDEIADESFPASDPPGTY